MTSRGPCASRREAPHDGSTSQLWRLSPPSIDAREERRSGTSVGRSLPRCGPAGSRPIRREERPSCAGGSRARGDRRREEPARRPPRVSKRIIVGRLRKKGRRPARTGCRIKALHVPCPAGRFPPPRGRYVRRCERQLVASSHVAAAIDHCGAAFAHVPTTLRRLPRRAGAIRNSLTGRANPACQGELTVNPSARPGDLFD
jgi:hypothetical protein